jgi:hypothetical protein
MSYDGAQLIMVIAGLIIAAAGIYMVVQAFGLDFTRYLRMGWMSRRTQDTVVQLGRPGPRGWTGHCARWPASRSAPSCSSWWLSAL